MGGFLDGAETLITAAEEGEADSGVAASSEVAAVPGAAAEEALAAFPAVVVHSVAAVRAEAGNLFNHKFKYLIEDVYKFC